ncbi:MAG TPA: 23S rRNA (uracil(1939)-C(5))-methyltransferase RlmD [bacterium]|nr:23S rRNA (uracil(1939)-C(5))-methyltransferase RlmD [bacterium]
MTESAYLIATLSTRGEGIARAGGKVTFIPFTLPGETWSADLIESKKNYGRALPRKMISPANPPAGRVEPRCPYFGSCGGCHLQHIPYTDQLRWKRHWLEETFRRVAHLEVQSADIEPSPTWEYRNKITLRVTKMGTETVLGYHRIYQPNRIIPITDCPIAHPLIRKWIPLVTDALNRTPLEIISPSPASPQGSRVVMQVRESSLTLSVWDVQLLPHAQEQLAEAWLAPPSPIDGVILRNFTGGAPRIWARSGKTTRVNDFATETFLQVNDTVREKLYAHILELPYRRRGSVLDGYCGVGLLTRRLAERFEKTVGVELNGEAVWMARKQVEQGGLSGRTQIQAGSLEAFLSKCRDSFDVWILNPPRAGLSSKVRSALNRRRPPECAIVSCHPAALARDVKALVDAGYTIERVQPFDMFPHTHHLETVIFLRRKWDP